MIFSFPSSSFPFPLLLTIEILKTTEVTLKKAGEWKGKKEKRKKIYDNSLSYQSGRLSTFSYYYYVWRALYSLYYWLKNIRLYHSVWTRARVTLSTFTILLKTFPKCDVIVHDTIFIQNNDTTCSNEINGVEFYRYDDFYRGWNVCESDEGTRKAD